MKISTKDVEQRLERFQGMCRRAGVKLTHQRIEIFKELARRGDHPDAEQVYTGVRERIPTVSLDTVYRTLWMLIDLKLIKTLGPPRERARFDANLSHHHHFICVSCGLTGDFSCDELDQLEYSASVKALGHVKSAQVEVRGMCNHCAAKAET